MASTSKISLHLISVVLLCAISIAKTIPVELEGNIDKISPPQKNLLINNLIENHEYGLRFRILIETTAPPDINKLAFIRSKYRFIAGEFLRLDACLPDILTASKLDYVRRIYVMDQIGDVCSDTEGNGAPRVIIGLVDVGMDWKSECFVNKDSGETRILWYWDQAAIPSPKSNRNEGFVPYGIEYSKEELQNIFKEESNSFPLQLGHGWIMASIAAGNVLIKDQNQTRIFKDSLLSTPIIMVNTTARKSSIFDAVAYIIQKAGALGAKCVINFPYSKHFGPHIEYQTFVKSIDSLLNENSILVVPSGNDRMSNVFTSRKIKGQAFIQFRLEKDKGLASLNDIGINANIELWAQENLDLEVSLINPDKKIIGPVANGKSETFNTSNGTFQVANTITKAVGNWHGISITFGGRGNELPKDGDWKIKIVSTGKEAGGLLKGWVTNVKNCNLQFINHSGISSSVSSLALGKEILSVGAVSIDDNRMVEAIYSSRIIAEGGMTKPDVLTIGKVMVRPPEFNDFFTQQGTSVSSALITRLIAFIWEKKPDLEASTIRSVLKGRVVNLARKKCKPNLSVHYQMTYIDDLFGLLEKK